MSQRITSGPSPAWPAIVYVAGSLIVFASTLRASQSWSPLLLLVHLAAFIVVTTVGWWILPAPRKPAGSSRSPVLLLGLAAGVAMLIFVYPWLHGAPPLIRALGSNDFDIIAEVRNQAILPDLLGFMLRMAIHGAAPVLILYLFRSAPRRLALPVIAAMVCGGALLLFKSMPLIMLIPLGVFAALERRWRLLVAVAATVAGILVCQVIATNPHLRGYVTLAMARIAVSPAAASTTPGSVSTGQAISLSVSGLVDRAFNRPGEGVATWLEAVPAKIPFSEGCSVRQVARWTGCEYRNLPREIYALAYPDYVARGFHGSLDVPHYVQDYAMFGVLGLALSGLAAAAGLLALRYAAGEPHPAYFMAIVVTAFVTGTPELLLSEGGLLAAALIVLIGRFSRTLPNGERVAARTHAAPEAI